MTTSLNDTVERYTISGTGPYAYSWRIFNDTDLTVNALHPSTSVPTSLSLSSNYTVAGENDQDGGSVSLIAGTASAYAGYTLDIRSNTPEDQPTSIRNTARFLPEIHEDAYDYLSRQIQDSHRVQALAPRLPDSELPTIDWDTLNSLANRKGKYGWFFNATTGLPELVSGISATAITQSVIGAALYPQTAAELSAGVTPVNYAYPPGDVRRYGTNTTPGTTDMTVAIQAAADVAAVNGGVIYFPPGEVFRATDNIDITSIDGETVDVVGSGWANGGILFDGASVTTGITYTGSGYSYAGTVCDLRLRGTNGAVRGVTFTDSNQAKIIRCRFSGFDGAGAAYLGTLMSSLVETLFTGCGSATEASVIVGRFGSIGSTTWKWDQSYISGGDTTVGGLTVNGTYHVSIRDGAIESSGIPIRIGNETDTTIGCVTGLIDGIDLENPGANPYIELGAGCSSAARIVGWRISNCNGSPSGSTTVTHAIQATVTSDLRCFGNNWSLPNGTSFHEFEGTSNLGMCIETHRQMFAVSGVPWVRINNVQQMAAGPQTAWEQSTMRAGLTSEKTISGTNPTVSVDDTQGGYHARLLMSNGGATNMATLTNGQEGCVIYLRAGNANTTIVHNPGTSDAFRNTSGANLTPTSGQLYGYIRGATDWVQIA